MASTSTTKKEIASELLPLIRVYKDGTVERLWGSPYVPPCPHDPQTNVSSKDITISHNPTISARLFLPQNQIYQNPNTFSPSWFTSTVVGFALNPPSHLTTTVSSTGWSHKPKSSPSPLSTGLPQKTHFPIVIKIAGMLFNGSLLTEPTKN